MQARACNKNSRVAARIRGLLDLREFSPCSSSTLTTLQHLTQLFGNAHPCKLFTHAPLVAWLSLVNAWYLHAKNGREFRTLFPTFHSRSKRTLTPFTAKSFALEYSRDTLLPVIMFHKERDVVTHSIRRVDFCI